MHWLRFIALTHSLNTRRHRWKVFLIIKWRKTVRTTWNVHGIRKFWLAIGGGENWKKLKMTSNRFLNMRRVDWFDQCTFFSLFGPPSFVVFVILMCLGSFFSDDVGIGHLWRLFSSSHHFTISNKSIMFFQSSFW